MVALLARLAILCFAAPSLPQRRGDGCGRIGGESLPVWAGSERHRFFPDPGRRATFIGRRTRVFRVATAGFRVGLNFQEGQRLCA